MSAAGRLGALALLAGVAAGSCQRHHAAGFPTPARAAVLVDMGFEQAFSALGGLLEARGIPVLVADDHFGTIRSDWVYFEAGDVDLTDLAVCDLPNGSPPPAVRIRYGFEVRRRANRATVSILTQYQTGARTGFDEHDLTWSDCRSTGEWERVLEQSLTQRGTIR